MKSPAMSFSKSRNAARSCFTGCRTRQGEQKRAPGAATMARISWGNLSRPLFFGAAYEFLYLDHTLGGYVLYDFKKVLVH